MTSLLQASSGQQVAMAACPNVPFLAIVRTYTCSSTLSHERERSTE